MSKHCKCKSTECEECPEWIFTFADLVMLMMGFFVILWVLKPPAGKDGEPHQDLPIEVLAAIREAFGYLPDPKSKDPIDVYMIMKKLEQIKPMKGQGDGGNTKLDRKSLAGSDVESQNMRPGKESILGAPIRFTKGDPKLSPEGARALQEFAKMIVGHRNIFLIKGHTSVDDLPETASDRDRMDLSLRRAQLVCEQLIAAGVSAEILRVQGCSTYEPVSQRAYSDDLKALNRRVEILAEPILVDDLQDSRKAILSPPDPLHPGDTLHPGEGGHEGAGPADAGHPGEGAQNGDASHPGTTPAAAAPAVAR